MGYDLKNVFYLDGSMPTVDSAGAAPAAGDSIALQLDLSSYVDPIGKGRTSGVGLAVYRVQFGLSDSSSGSDPIDVGQTGVMRAGLVAGAGTGNVTAGTTLAVNSSNAPSAKNDLTVAAFDFYGPSAFASNDMVSPTTNVFIEPSKEVPYVVVRDNICLIGVIKETFLSGSAVFVQFRMECAMIPLDKSTLNQLLRTQTV